MTYSTKASGLMKTSKHLLALRTRGATWRRLALGFWIASQAITHCQAGSTIFAWGANEWLQTQVPPGLTNAVGIAGGYAHSLALNRDGTVVAWGLGNSGQTMVPADLTNAVALAADGFYSL